MKNQYIQLVPADLSLAEQVLDYYKRNKSFLEAFEPKRSEEFFSLEYQRKILKNEMADFEEKTAFHFYIIPLEQPSKIIGSIGVTSDRSECDAQKQSILKSFREKPFCK